jgi:hypothetical protein
VRGRYYDAVDRPSKLPGIVDLLFAVWYARISRRIVDVSRQWWKRVIVMSRTVQVNVEVPDDTPEEAIASAQSQAKETVVLVLWQAGTLTTREAAAELDLTYLDFLDLLAARGIPVESRSPDLIALEEAERKLAANRQ